MNADKLIGRLVQELDPAIPDEDAYTFGVVQEIIYDDPGTGMMKLMANWCHTKEEAINGRHDYEYSKYFPSSKFKLVDETYYD